MDDWMSDEDEYRQKNLLKRQLGSKGKQRQGRQFFVEEPFE
jgi:hypothetical protein